MSHQQNQNNAIEAIRFCMTCIICLCHCNVLAPAMHNPDLPVEFFFILSGYLMYNSWQRNPNRGVLSYSMSKVKRMIIPLYISLLLLMLLDRKQYLIMQNISPDDIIQTYFLHLHEFFFCTGVGLSNINGINYPIWYISILVLGGGILYALLRHYKYKAISIIIPLICIFGFNYIYENGCLTETMHIHGMNQKMIRGISEMGLGILLASFISRYKYRFERRKLIISFAGLFGFTCFTMMIFATNRYDYLNIFAVPLIIIALVVDGSIIKTILNHKLCSKFGNISLYMYIIHLFIASIYYILRDRIPMITDISPVISIPMYLIIVIIASHILKEISIRIEKKIFAINLVANK